MADIVQSSPIEDAYAAKTEEYFKNARHDYVAALPVNPKAAILELGCGSGATGALALRNGKAGNYIGIELFAPVAFQAQSVLTTVHTGDIETMGLPYEPETFDVLICSEVLEHLRDPQAVLGRLVKLLKADGIFCASVPNLANWRILFDLICGEFQYTESGLMDRTHLRWFTPKSFRRLCESSGICVDSIGPMGRAKQIQPLLDILPFGHTVWSQISVVGHKHSRPPSLA